MYYNDIFVLRNRDITGDKELDQKKKKVKQFIPFHLYSMI